MRLDHRQRTGLFRHLPLYFTLLGVLAGVSLAPAAAFGASARTAEEGLPVARDGSEDPEGLLELYLDYLLKKMKGPVPVSKSSAAYALAVVREYEDRGTPRFKPFEVPEFVNAIVSTQELLVTHPNLLDADTTDRLNNALEGMLADLVTEGRVAP